MKYSAHAECEIIFLWKIVKYRVPWPRCEIKFVPSHAAGVFHCRRQFHTRQRISLVPKERISLKKHLRMQVLFLGTRNGNRTHNCPLGGGCYIHLTMQAYSIQSCPHKEEAEKYAVLPCSPAWAYGGPSGARTQDQPVMSR